MQPNPFPQASPHPTTSRIEGIGVPDLFWSLCRTRATGILHLASADVEKKVYVRDGRILFAASSDPNERLGETLLRGGVIRLDQLEQAIARLPEGKRLGTILIEAGHLTPEQLIRGIVDQVRSIVLGVFAWDQGEFRFDEGPLPTEEVVTLPMSTPELLLQGIRGIRSFSRIRASVGPPRTVYRTVGDPVELAEGLDLRDEERRILDLLAEGTRTLEHLCEDVLLSNFEVYQAIWAFRVLGCVERVERAPEADAPFAVEGRIEGDGVAGLILRLCRSGESGILHLSRGAVERTLHVKEGRCVFATSNRADDGLVAHLLRRGMISVKDQEEAARHLLSNRRVGTILLERGVLDSSDLQNVVREQIGEILLDSFTWSSGDWAFVPGPLPTDEEITLDRSIEDLVFEGCRRVTAWSRVRDGCGGPTRRLALTSEYLTVLDRMNIAPEDWEIVSRLRAPATTLDLCRSSALGDFRVCQSLWALRVIGVVREAPIEDALDAALDALTGPGAAAPTEEAAAIAAEAPRDPIAPADLPEGSSFEVTSLEAMTPTAEVTDRAIAPSDWQDVDSPDALFGPHAWPPEAGEPSVPVSDGSGASEIVSEAWQLAGETPAPMELPPVVDPAPEQGFVEEPEWSASADDGVVVEDDGVTSAPPEEPEWSASADDGVAVEDDGATSAPPEEPEWSASADDGVVVEDDGATSAPVEDRDAVEALLSDAAAELEACTADGEEAWRPPEGLESEIVRLNARHKLVFRVIRSEVGAGAVNFIRSCAAAAEDGSSTLFSEAPLLPDGTWDPAALRRLVIERRIDDPAPGFRRLVEREIERLRVQIGESRSRELATQVDAIV